MATFTEIKGKKGTTWQARIRKPGYAPVAQNFPSRKEAEDWATVVEADMITRKHVSRPKAPGKRLADLIDLHIADAMIAKAKRDAKDRGSPESEAADSPFGKNKTAVLKALKRQLGDILVKNLTKPTLVSFIRSRSAEGAGGVTIGMDLGYLKTVLTAARDIHDIAVDPSEVDKARATFKALGLNPKSKKRDRLPTADEVTQIKTHFESKKRQKIPMGVLIEFARATAMRLSEIVRLRWADLNEDDKTILVRARKHPDEETRGANNQTVPVLIDAMAIIHAQPRASERIFPFKAASISTIFPRAVKACKIENLHFHDFRHEGTTRLFEDGYRIEEVAVFTGHSTWEQLKRYTHIKAKNLHLDRNGKPRRIVPELSNPLVHEDNLELTEEI